MSEAVKTGETLRQIGVPVGRGNEYSGNARNGLLCALTVVVCVLIAYPVANMPFSDGFSYAKSSLEFARTGQVLYNGWATAMLGWLIPWGAIFIKIFGFSFTVLRLSMLPIVAATACLFHQILLRFGLNSQNAVFGTLALALSPIFLLSAASYMTDVPGLLIIFACIYMCQRAVMTPSDRAALLWLGSATIINVLGGTVRQIAWLGALVVVPATAALLRERRSMKVAGVVLWVFSVICVLLCLNWFNRQPYSVPEHLIWASVHPINLVHLAAQLIKAFLCLLLIILPVSVAWLPSARRLNRNAWLRLGGVMVLLTSLASLAYATGRLDTWLMPWLMFLLPEQSSLVPGMFGTPIAMTLWIRLAISLMVIAVSFLMAEQLAIRKQSRLVGSESSSMSWKAVVWILGSFSASYILLLTPRGAFDQIQDRYLVGLVPVAIVFLLRLYQERVCAKLPTVSFVALLVFAIYSIAGTHDLFAACRAQVRAIQMVESSGVPRTFIQAGFASDAWVQVENGGHINEPRIRVPAGAYNPNPPDLIPESCRDGFTKFAPIITPKYFVHFPWFKAPTYPAPSWCFVHANFPPIVYRTWLPPFTGTLYVKRLANRPN